MRYLWCSSNWHLFFEDSQLGKWSLHHFKAGKRFFVREVISENFEWQSMATQLMLFGDIDTADIKLRLISSDGAEHKGSPLYIHSQVLRKSEFYITLLSECWSLDKRSLEVEGTNSQSVDEYIKCIKLMYSTETSGNLRFSNVDEALAILPIASQLLFHQCIEECMQYLDAVHWNQLKQLRNSSNVIPF